ncbi:hypothetical protein [Orientia tsutsugamushi]|uniref:hypothetical protein n=1 Tax=Orientia tsutsugamushi TaxID=784 RepID=UPI00352832FE
MRLLSILTLITLNISCCLASMQNDYNEARNYNRPLSKLVKVVQNYKCQRSN